MAARFDSVCFVTVADRCVRTQYGDSRSGWFASSVQCSPPFRQATAHCQGVLAKRGACATARVTSGRSSCTCRRAVGWRFHQVSLANAACGTAQRALEAHETGNYGESSSAQPGYTCLRFGSSDHNDQCVFAVFLCVPGLCSGWPSPGQSFLWCAGPQPRPFASTATVKMVEGAEKTAKTAGPRCPGPPAWAGAPPVASLDSQASASSECTHFVRSMSLGLNCQVGVRWAGLQGAADRPACATRSSCCHSESSRPASLCRPLSPGNPGLGTRHCRTWTTSAAGGRTDAAARHARSRTAPPPSAARVRTSRTGAARSKQRLAAGGWQRRRSSKR